MRVGPLHGLRVIEFAAMGTVPFCGMLLADMGADVIRIDRPEKNEHSARLPPEYEFNLRNRRSIALNLKSSDGLDIVRKLIGGAHALIEGFRPGVMERLGLGPADCAKTNAKLVYGRLTGWGQDGPLAQLPGHDINFVAFAGVLNFLGGAGRLPAPPPQGMLGDLGGGALYLAFGVVCALLEAQKSGIGQTVDAAIVDGLTSLLTPTHGRRAGALQAGGKEPPIAGGIRPWYRAYETSDGKWITIGPVEGQFYRELLKRLGLDGETLPAQHDVSGWPVLERRFAEIFRLKTQREWVDILQETETCFAPALSLQETIAHPHAQARGMFTEFDGVLHPSPAPRFSRTAPEIRRPPATPGAHTDAVLADCGYDPDQIAQLRRAGAVA